MFTIVILNVYVTKCHKGHSCTHAIPQSVARYSTHLLSPLFPASLIPHPPPRLCQSPLPVYPNYRISLTTSLPRALSEFWKKPPEKFWGKSTKFSACLLLRATHSLYVCSVQQILCMTADTSVCNTFSFSAGLLWVCATHSMHII